MKPRFWDQLLEFIGAGEVIPILGRDLLTCEIDGRAEPLYPYLARRLAGYLDVSADDLPRGGELNTIACRYVDGPGRGDLEEVYAALKSVVPQDADITIPAPLRKLAEIRPLQLFVTTTFDSLLQRAIDDVRFGGQAKTQVMAYSPQRVVDLPAAMRSLERPTVYHLFGKLSALPDYVITDEDTLEFVHSLQTRSKRPELLFDELMRHQLLLIGSSFPDWLTRFVIRAAEGERLSLARGTNFVADDAVRGSAELREFLRHFSSRTKVFDTGGPVEFVDELHAHWRERHPDDGGLAAAVDAVPTTTEMPRGAVFLSYASEDLEPVTRMRTALEAAGVDVWFDKDALQGGDRYEAKIRGSIGQASLFVPVISKHTLTVNKRFFRIEWNQARRVAEMVADSQRFIFPIAIDATPPHHDAIPAEFRALHWERAVDGQCTAELVALIRQLFRDFHKARATA